MKQRVVVRAGDCVASIAARFGADPDAVWDDPDNAELRRLRGTPYVLSPGDVVHVTLPEPATLDPGGVRRFRVRVPKVRIHLRILGHAAPDEQDPRAAPAAPSARANAPYELTVGARVYRGRTDGAGALEEWIPATEKLGTLVVNPGGEDECRTVLRIGYLNPEREPGGLAQRLRNVGFDPRPHPDAPEDLRAALRMFQRAHRLDVTGELDDATRARLDDLLGETRQGP